MLSKLVKEQNFLVFDLIKLTIIWRKLEGNVTTMPNNASKHTKNFTKRKKINVSTMSKITVNLDARPLFDFHETFPIIWISKTVPGDIVLVKCREITGRRQTLPQCWSEIFSPSMLGRNRDREKSSGLTIQFNIWTIWAMDRTWAQPQVNLSLLRSNSFKFQGGGVKTTENKIHWPR